MVLTSDSRTGKGTPFSLPPPHSTSMRDRHPFSSRWLSVFHRNLGRMFTGAVYLNNRTVAWRLTVFMAFVSVIDFTRILVTTLWISVFSLPSAVDI